MATREDSSQRRFQICDTADVAGKHPNWVFQGGLTMTLHTGLSASGELRSQGQKLFSVAPSGVWSEKKKIFFSVKKDTLASQQSQNYLENFMMKSNGLGF